MTKKATTTGVGPGPVGRNIRRLRDRRGWSQAKLSEESGVNRTTIATLESGTHQSPSMGTIAELANALGVEPHDLTLDITEVPMGDLLKEFLDSYWGRQLQPTATEMEWLKGIHISFWVGCKPSTETLYHLLIAYRLRSK